VRSYFFLGYAEDDGADVYVRRFADDLRREVRELIEPHRDHDSVPAQLPHADFPLFSPFRPSAEILDCRVLVALYSEAYFGSGRCVREWTLFYERMRWYRQRSGQCAPSLVGIPWSMEAARLPGVVRAASSMPNVPGAATQSGGKVIELVSDIRHAVQYRMLVSQVAALVVAGADTRLPMMTETDVPHIPPHPDLASGIRDASADRPAATDAGGGSGRRHQPTTRAQAEASMGRAGVVVGAAPADSQPQDRTRREFYGVAPENWRPFLPASDQPAYSIARHKLDSIAIHDTVCYPASSELSTDLAHARDERRVVVVLLDPWLVRSEDRRTAVRELARHIFDAPPVAGTLVVFSQSDEETESHAEELRAELRHHFLREYPESAARLPEVRTHKQLAEDLVPIVVRAQNALMREPPTPPTSAGDPGSASGGPRRGPGEPGGGERSKPIIRRRRQNGTGRQT
jgi:FxsC-like protein